MSTMKRRQGGFTLMEIMMVLVIGAVITIGGITWYQSSQARQQSTDAVRDLNTLVTVIRSVYNGQGDYNGLANATVTRASSFPQPLRVPGNAALIKSQWLDDGVDLAAATQDTADDSFSITYKDLDDGACVDFTTQVYTYFDEVNVDGTTVASVADIAGNCADGVDVEFIGR